MTGLCTCCVRALGFEGLGKCFGKALLTIGQVANFYWNFGIFVNRAIVRVVC